MERGQRTVSTGTSFYIVIVSIVLSRAVRIILAIALAAVVIIILSNATQPPLRFDIRGIDFVRRTRGSQCDMQEVERLVEHRRTPAA